MLALTLLATLLQLLACILALRLMRVTGRRLAWGAVAAALLLMVLRRVLSLFEVTDHSHDHRWEPAFEALGLLISLLFVVGVHQLSPLVAQWRQSAERLRDSEARLRQVIDLVPHLIFIKDREGRFLLANRAMAAFYGRQPEELVGQRHSDLHPDAQEIAELLAADRAVIDSGQPQSLTDYQFTDSTGRRHYLQTLKTPYQIEGSAERAVLGVAIDVTERHDLEVAERRERDFVTQLLDTAGALIIVIDRQGRVLRFNRACEQLTGYTATEVKGRVFWDYLLVPEERDSVRQVFLALVAGDFPLRYENYWVTRTGQRRRIAWANTCVTDARGAVEYVIGTGIDVTEQRVAEEALRLNERRLQALNALGEMDDATLTELTDFALEEAVRLTGSTIGYLAFMNEDESVLTMHSWSRSAMRECAIADKPIVYPVADTGLWGEAVRQRQAIITNDYTAPNPLKKGYPPGHVAIKRHMNVPIFDGQRIVLVAGVGNKADPYDDSDVRQLRLLMQGMWRLVQRRQALANLQELNESLEQKIAERTRDLQRSNQELQQFAYVASHDLQEPLRMVSSYVQLLAQRYRGQLDRDADDFIGFAVDGAERMQRLIEDLLAYSRVGTRGAPAAPVALESVLAQAEQNLQAAIAETGAVITHDPLPTVVADGTQMGQLLQNLLGNALKFRGPEPPRLHVGCTDDGAHWIFSVKDNGIGFDMAYAERIFVIFQRLHPREEYPGTGMGLAICSKIVERHGGRIWAEAAPGAGATFFFTLPKERGEAE